jgi:short subunit fatty acids transporter
VADNKNKQIPVSDSLLMRRNLLMAFVLLVFLLLLYVSVPGYNWAITEMAIRNKELIDKIEVRRLNNNMPELSMEDKRLFKIQNYWYIKF